MRYFEIRRRFVEYYQNLGFQLLPRAPMMHPSIPMSFVMSAGLVQVETSLANSQNRSGNKFVLVQNCFRHFDLETIGTDNTHLSLFEMPAAFIFGENPRKAAITQIWHVATEELGIDSKRLWITYFSGDELDGHFIPEDRETYQVWREVGVPEQRLIGLDRNHNYWVQGGGIRNGGTPLRKCGANTELFYDRGPEYSCSSSNCRPGCRCGRFVEFSNTLFVTHHLNYNAKTFTPMEEPFTESVVGTERLAMILQEIPSVFETSAYSPMLRAIHQFVTNTELTPALMEESERVIADHVRALYVLVADGAPPPGKDGRERIVKLLIRDILTRQILLGIASSVFLPPILRTLTESFSITSEISFSEAEQTLLSYFQKEQTRFFKTIESGKRQLNRLLRENHGATLSGGQIVLLEKKHGLPYLLIASILKEQGFEVLNNEYQNALHRWKQGIIRHD